MKNWQQTIRTAKGTQQRRKALEGAKRALRGSKPAFVGRGYWEDRPGRLKRGSVALLQAKLAGAGVWPY